MMKETHTILRDRYQLTIPEKIRSSVSWLVPNAPVRILVLDDGRVMLDRHMDADRKWQLVEKAFKITRSKKFSSPLSEMVEKDRLDH